MDETSDSGLLSSRAEIFRSKLITDFHLIDNISSKGLKVDSPCYYTEDIIGDHSQASVWSSNPDGLVRIKGHACFAPVPYERRRKNRIRNKNAHYLRLDLWANKIVNSRYFQNIVLGVIIANVIVLGIQEEIADREGSVIEVIHSITTVFDYFALAVFIIEIILKWMDQFQLFWQTYWNIFDFVITLATIVPELMVFYIYLTSDGSTENASKLATVASNLRSFRILRALKMVTRFNNVRLIVLAVTKAFQAMVFITILLVIFAYIFAIIGVIFFGEGYKNASEGDLRYKDSFATIVDALITLFQIFTLDQWYSVYQDTISVSDYFFGATYIILWILMGSLVFRNLFVGIMVNNFQTIRDELAEEVQKIKMKEKQQKEMMKFVIELGKQMSWEKKTPQAISSEDEAFRQPDKNDEDTIAWQKTVEENLEVLGKDDTVFFWPKDSLFQYFLMMENLVENLHEREKLYQLLTEALLSIHDTG